MNKRKLIKEIKKDIRKRHDNKSFYKIDKVLKITKIKILEVKESRGGSFYDVEYKYGLNLINPFSWIIIIIPGIFMAMYKGMEEIFKEVHLDSYTDQLIKSAIDREVKK